jgi:hypothetical protein
VAVLLAHNNNMEILVDDQDLPLVSSHTWTAERSKNTWYAITGWKRNSKWSTVRMHRLILGEPKGFIDHHNRNGLDNRRHNLRVASYSQNGGNRGKASNASHSTYKGVIRSANGQNWIAMIASRYLGTYATEEEAAVAYDIASRKRYGEFAITNFPDIRPTPPRLTSPVSQARHVNGTY